MFVTCSNDFVFSAVSVPCVQNQKTWLIASCKVQFVCLFIYVKVLYIIFFIANKIFSCWECCNFLFASRKYSKSRKDTLFLSVFRGRLLEIQQGLTGPSIARSSLFQSSTMEWELWIKRLSMQLNGFPRDIVLVPESCSARKMKYNPMARSSRRWDVMSTQTHTILHVH